MVDPDGGQTLDMTGRNLEARERILSRRSPFAGLSRDRIQEAMSLADQGLSPDEMTAMRLSRPRFETSTLEIGDRDLGPVPQYTSTEMNEPSASDLSRSAAFWKISGQPLDMATGEADVTKTLAEAGKEEGLEKFYEAQAAEMGKPDTMSFEEFAAKVLPALKAAGITDIEGALIGLWEYQQTGVRPEQKPEEETGAYGKPKKGFFRRLFSGDEEEPAAPEELDARFRR